MPARVPFLLSLLLLGAAALPALAKAPTKALAAGGCIDSASTLCLGGRFTVTGTWRTDIASGAASAQRLTADTGYLWFFNSANVEAVIKVLDGCGVNGHYWVFAGGLTDVEVALTVTDTGTGAVKTYANAAHTKFQPIQDTSAFATCSAPLPFAAPVVPAAFPPPASLAGLAQGGPADAVTGSCTPDATSLCLNGGRFRVQAQYSAGPGNAGAGQAVRLTPDTGYFWFFGSSNVEAVVKVIDGCGVNEHYWVFAGGLTNVNVVLTVTDTLDGSEQTYTNPAGTAYQPIQDTSAFSFCAPPGDAPPRASFNVTCVERTCTAATSSSDDVGIDRYRWDWGDGTPVEEPTVPFPWADQTHTYSHSGRFTITHTVLDTAGQSGSAQMEVVANIAPVAANDAVTIFRDTTVTIDLLANDSDADGDTLSFGSVSQAHPGATAQTVATPTGPALRFTPPDTYVGVLTFTYVAFDPWGGQDTATVTVTVNQTGGRQAPTP